MNLFHVQMIVKERMICYIQKILQNLQEISFTKDKYTNDFERKKKKSKDKYTNDFCIQMILKIQMNFK